MRRIFRGAPAAHSSKITDITGVRVFKRLLGVFILVLVSSGSLLAQRVQKVSVSPGGDLVTAEFYPLKSATCTDWLNVASYGSSTHKLTFTYRTAPSGVTVTFKTSKTYGATTATTDTSTSTTGTTIERTGATANAIQICVSGLTGSIEMLPVYRGSDFTVSVAGGGDTTIGAVTIADGDDSAEGTTTNSYNCSTDGTSVTVISALKCNNYLLQTPPQADFSEGADMVISTGGVAETAVALNSSRKRILVQNPCSAGAQGIATAESIWVRFNGTASATAGIELTPCGIFDSASGNAPVSTQAVSVYAATSSHRFYLLVQ